jgi:hypothetical protein
MFEFINTLLPRSCRTRLSMLHIRFLKHFGPLTWMPRFTSFRQRGGPDYLLPAAGPLFSVRSKSAKLALIPFLVYTLLMSRDRDPLVLGLVREAQNLAAAIRFGEAILKFQDGRVVFCEVKETYRSHELDQLERVTRAEVPVTGQSGPGRQTE